MSEKIEYYLPEKVFKLTVKYLVKQELTYNSDNELIKVKAVDCYINDDVVLEQVIVPDYKQKFVLDYSEFTSWIHQINFEVVFDDNSAGILQSLNMESTPVLKDIISGAVDVASSLVRLGTGVFLTASATEPLIKVETRERTINETYLIIIKEENFNGTVYLFNPEKPTIDDTFNTNKIPGIEFTIEPSKLRINHTINNLAASKNKIFYREPVLSRLKILIQNNGAIKEQVVIDDFIYLPQIGELKTIQLTAGNFFNKTGNVVNFNKNTGGLQKFSLTNESKMKETLESSNGSIKAINTLIGDIDKNKRTKSDSLEKERKKELDEKKAALKAEQDKEIETLKREKEILNLKSDIKKLKGE